MFKPKNYKNSTELTNVNGVPIYMRNMVDAALRGRLNVFLQGWFGYACGADTFKFRERLLLEIRKIATSAILHSQPNTVYIV